MKKYIKVFLISIFIFLVGILNVYAEENIELISVELQEKSPYVEINEEVSLDGNKIISNVNFFDEGDYVIYKFKIKNNDDKDYKIDEIFDNNDSEYLSFEYTYDEEIGAKEEKEVLLKVTYKAILPYDATLTPTNEFNAVNEISVSIKLSEEVINPSTFDKAHIYLVLEIVAVCGLLIIFIKLKKKNAVMLLIVALLLIPKNTNAKIEFKINFTFKNTMNLKVNYLDQNWKTKITDSYNKLEFIKTLEYPEGAIDVSQEQDESIKAWIEDDTLYIGSKFKIFFPKNSKELFKNVLATNINFNDRIDTTFVTNMERLLDGCSNIEYIDFSSFRTGNVEKMSYMFYQTKNLKELDLSPFDTSNVTEFYYPFSNTVSLEKLILDGLDLSNVISMEYFISSCTSLKTISAKNLQLPINASNMFRKDYGPYTLESIDLTGSNTSTTTSLYAMFEDQRALKEIKGIDGWDTSKVTDIAYMFCRTGQNVEGAEYSFDLSNWDLSNVVQSYYMFSEFGTKADEIVINISNWSAPLLTDFSAIFYKLGENANYIKLDAEDLNLSNVTSFTALFREFGINSNKIDFNVSNWDISNLTGITYLFKNFGYRAKEIHFNLNGWENDKITSLYELFREVAYYSNIVEFNISNFIFPEVTDMQYAFCYLGKEANEISVKMNNIVMPKLDRFQEGFEGIGEKAQTVTMNLENFSIPNVQNVVQLFIFVGQNASKVEVNLKNWDMSNCLDANSMFYTFATDAIDEVKVTLENIDMSKSTNFWKMFYNAGRYTKSLNFDFKNVDISSGENLSSMFAFIGSEAEEWNFTGLDQLDFSSATNLYSFLYNISSGNYVRDIGTLDFYGSRIEFILQGTKGVKGTINFHNNVTSYTSAFDGVATVEGSEIIVNYTSDVTNIDNIINTKSSNSNVIKGELINN